MNLLEATQQLQDLYEAKVAVCYFSHLGDQNGYSLVYYQQGTLYYSVIWMRRNESVDPTDYLWVSQRSRIPLYELVDIDRLKQADGWDVISPDQFAAYNEQQFVKQPEETDEA